MTSNSFYVPTQLLLETSLSARLQSTKEPFVPRKQMQLLVLSAEEQLLSSVCQDLSDVFLPLHSEETAVSSTNQKSCTVTSLLRNES